MGPARSFIANFAVLFLLLAGGSAAQEEGESQAPRSQPKHAASSEADPIKLNAEVIRTMTAYRASLEQLLRIYEQDFKKKVAEVRERREIYEKGYISRLELDQSRRELAGAEGAL